MAAIFRLMSWFLLLACSGSTVAADPTPGPVMEGQASCVRDRETGGSGIYLVLSPSPLPILQNFAQNSRPEGLSGCDAIAPAGGEHVRPPSPRIGCVDAGACPFHSSDQQNFAQSSKPGGLSDCDASTLHPRPPPKGGRNDDAFGRRFRWSDGRNTSYFLYDGSAPFAEFNASGTLQRRIFWGPTGPICLRQSSNRWFIADKFGNTRVLVDDYGAITDYYAYDAWGNPVSAKSSGSSYNPFRWNGSSGYQFVNQTALYHVGAREYDPTVGRWLQRDPIEMAGRHPNLYVYVANNPVEMIDESGLQATGKISKIVFNGNTLSIIRTDGTVWKIPAYSGVAGRDKSDQGKSCVGPIPAGKYYVDPAEDQFATSNPFSWPGAGYPYSDKASWGDRKIPIKGGPNSGRDGFFLHGGDDVGSAGCVDIGPRDIDVIDWIGGKHPNGSRIPFVVDYAGQTGKVPIHPGTGQAYSWEDWMQLLRKWAALKKKR